MTKPRTPEPAKPGPGKSGGTMRPFADDAASLSIGELTVENGQDRVALYGRLDVSRDRAGLAQAKALKSVLDQIVQVLEAEPALPEAVAPPEAPKQVKNPFA